MDCGWKSNWCETKQHFIDWWQHDGLVLGSWGFSANGISRDASVDPGLPEDVETRYADTRWRALSNYYGLSRGNLIADILAMASTDIGPGSLALALGAEPGFSTGTVWFHPTMKDVEHPEMLPPLLFNPQSRWWQVHEATMKACVELGTDKFMVGCPDLVENIDILSALRDPQTMLFDMIERPEWVSEKVSEINRAWFAAYQRVYDIIKLSDGSSAYGAFALWGPGKTAKVQCDACAMFSPAMFEQFVLPALTEQCGWLDHSMYHLDGSDCLPHLELLLSIDELDAIEWTTDPKVPGGGDPCWYAFYRKILDAGKSVQVVGPQYDEIIPLLDAIGGKGVYILTDLSDQRKTDELMSKVEQYR